MDIMCFWEKSISLVQERKKVVLSYQVVTKKYTEKVAWEQKLKESEGVILWSHWGRYFWAEGRTMNNCRHSEGWADLGINSEIAKRPVGLESSKWEEKDPGVRMGISLRWSLASCLVTPPDYFLQKKENLCDSALRGV